MRRFRFLHAADLHLGSPFRGMSSLPDIIRSQCVISPYKALQRLVEIAIQEKVDFVLISGDLYDRAHPSLADQLKFQAEMETLATHHIQVFLIHGNHDPLEEGTRANLTLPDNVHIFPSDHVTKRPAYDRTGQIVAYVYGISYATPHMTSNLALQYEAQDEHMYNIAMLHCNVDGDREHASYAPCTKQQLIRSGMQYWALGHIHKRSVLHTAPHIVYPGNTQGRHVRELGEKGVYIVDVSERGETELTFHPTHMLLWFEKSLVIDGMMTEQHLIDRLIELIERVREEAKGQSAIVRVVLEGQGILHHTLQQRQMSEQIADLIREKEVGFHEATSSPFVWLESIIVRTRDEVQREQLLNDESFLGELLRISDTLQSEGDIVSVVRQALEPLLSHRDVGTYVQAIDEEQCELWLRRAEEMAIQLIHEEV